MMVWHSDSGLDLQFFIYLNGARLCDDKGKVSIGSEFVLNLSDRSLLSNIIVLM